MTIEQTSTQDCDQAPIHSLPDEILEAIFLINTSKLVKQGNENHPYDPHLTTLATAQVCQRWRAVALDYPVIWSRIINYEKHSPLWIETLLARSGSTLIDVGVDSPFEPVRLQHPQGKPVLQSIFQRISCLKTVSLHIQRDLWESILFLGHPAPNLEFLNLSTSCKFPKCLYPNPLFADEAPCLRRLHLEGCLIDFSSSVLSNLTVLSVTSIVAVPGRSHLSTVLPRLPSVAGWLRVLKNIPALRFLKLINVISYFTEHEPPLPFVDLPQLALLTINTRFFSGISLIDHLNVPPLCGIEFGLYHISRHESTDHRLLSFLSKQLTHWPQNYSDRYLRANICYGHKILIGNCRHVGQASHSKDPMLSLFLTFHNLEDSFAFFNQLLELYSSTFSTTTTLDLQVNQEYMGIANVSFPAFSTLYSFTNVKTLNLLGQSPLYLLPLFQNSSLPDHPLLFPALQSLHLTGTNMEDEEGAMCRVFVAFLQSRVEAGTPLPEIKMVAFLQSRVEAGTPLPEIKMIGGYISNQTAEILSRIGNLRISLDPMALKY